MKLTFASVVAALAAVAAAKPTLTNSAYDVVAGQPFQLTWTGASAPVTIELKTGPSKALKTFSVLATGATGGSATVQVPKDLPSGEYAFAIRDGEGEDNTNYSTQFPLKGNAVSSAASSSVSSTPASSSVRSMTSASSSSTSTTKSVSSTASATNSSASTSGTSTSASRTPSSTAAGPTVTPPNNNSSGANIQSSLALVLLGAVAVAFLN